MNIEIESSYKKNNIGKTIYEIVLKYRPKIIIDFGVLHGYSSICMATAIKEIGEGRVFAYDLWEKYPYKHAVKDDVTKNIDEHKLSNFITIGQIDFYEWIENPTDFDLMHIDISNDGDIIEIAYNKLKSFIDKGSVIIFEGGTEERDKEWWMIEYNKKSIFPLKEIIKYEIINPSWPGLSLISNNGN